MREIKFRAWNGSKMIVPQENSYYQHYVSFCGGIVQKSSEGMECFGGGDIWRIVDNTMLMQYTGLKDRNGVEIFEGDIVEWVSTHAGSSDLIHTDVIEWIDDAACFLLMPFCHEPYAADMKVIGNIHENPELLEREA